LSHRDAPVAGKHQDANDVVKQFVDRLKRSRGTWVATAALLAVTTGLIASVPSLFGNTGDDDTLSYGDRSPDGIRNLDGSTWQTASAENVQAVVSGRYEGGTLVATAGVPANSAAVDDVPVSDDTARPGDDTVSVQQLPGENVDERSLSQQGRYATPDAIVTGDTVTGELARKAPFARYDSVLARGQDGTADLQSPTGYINRNASQQQPTAAGGTALVASAGGIHAVSARFQDEKISELLSLGQQSISDYRLLTPVDDNAYDYFRAVLRLDPGNEAAQSGIQKIVAIYITLSRKALDRNYPDKARRYLDRGLSIQPGNHQLLALKDSVDSNMNWTSDGANPVADRGRASVNRKERASRDRLMSRITTLFKKRKAEAETGIVIAPAGRGDG
jgi:hypothetical protein